jgi:hypothetical protein
MTVSPTPEKIDKTVAACKLLLAKSATTIQQVAEVIGLLVSNFPGVEYGPLHYRELELAKSVALTLACGVYGSKMTLPDRCRHELEWWISNLPYSTRQILHGKPIATVQSDASIQGWGAVREGTTTGGRWSTIEQQAHINVLELKAAFFALKSLCVNDKEGHIHLQLDNTTAVAYINKMGGTQSRPLNQLAVEIWQWCIERNIWISATHIAGKVNVEADRMSRVFHDKHEWQLNKQTFQNILTKFPSLEIDLFASRVNFQLAQYAAWRPDPGCIAVDAFTLNWETKMFYAFPPFSLVPRCLQKILQDQASGVLIAPFWPTQAWFPQLLQLLFDQPWIIATSPDLLRHPVQSTSHPLAKTLRLMVCPVSGIALRQTTFQKKLQISLCHLGEQAPRNNIPPTSKNGWTFVVKGRLLVIHQQ